MNKEVNKAVAHLNLLDYQLKLDTSALERSSNKLAQNFKVCFYMYTYLHEVLAYTVLRIYVRICIHRSNHVFCILLQTTDLTSNGRVLLHEGSLTWKLQNKKLGMLLWKHKTSAAF